MSEVGLAIARWLSKGCSPITATSRYRADTCLAGYTQSVGCPGSYPGECRSESSPRNYFRVKSSTETLAVLWIDRRCLAAATASDRRLKGLPTRSVPLANVTVAAQVLVALFVVVMIIPYGCRDDFATPIWIGSTRFVSGCRTSCYHPVCITLARRESRPWGRLP